VTGETYFHAACYNNKEKAEREKKRRKGPPRVADYWARVSGLSGLSGLPGLPGLSGLSFF